MHNQPISKLDHDPVNDSQIDPEELRLKRQIPRDAWWTGLTTLPQKWKEYSRESFFRESVYDLESALGRDMISSLQSVATIGIKPEAMAGRRGERILEFLFEHGYSVIDFRQIRYSPLISREIWRFQWNVATLDRLCLWDYIADQGPALLVTLRDRTEHPDIPASVRLRGLKGPAIPQLRRSGTLREACMAPNRILTMVHAADEPIDIAREAGILMPSPERVDWANRIRHDAQEFIDGPCIAGVREVYKSFPTTDFDIEVSRRRVRNSIATLLRNRKAEHEARVLTAFLDETAAMDGSFQLRDWWQHAIDTPSCIDPWDLILIASHAIQHDAPDEVCTIDDDGRAEWIAGLGAMAWKGAQ